MDASSRILAGVFVATAALSAPAMAADTGPSRTPERLERWKGDFDGMLERRLIRVLVVPNKTNFYIDRGRQRGLNYEAFELFGQEINKRHDTGKVPLKIQYIPVSRQQLIPALLEGRGDIASGNITVTPEREALVDFSIPVTDDAREIIVTAKDAPALATLDDLAGRTVYVRPGTSYFDSLSKLSARLVKEGKAPIQLGALPPELENEDKLEMVNAGLIDYVVIESYLAKFWQQVFPDIVIREDLAVREDAKIAVAFRKDSPKLAAEINQTLATTLKTGSKTRNILFQRYLASADYVTDATSAADMRRFDEAVTLFRRYGAEYDFDYLLLMAQAYQESRLDHSAKSHVGAIGIMQVMPATGREMKVGDIHEVGNNIHAGTKYLRRMEQTYFGDAPMDRLNQTLFAFAAYNAGPSRVDRLRTEAMERGLNPNVWFNNVEIVASERVGRETVQYVGNIFKYYVAYRLLRGESQLREAARESVAVQKTDPATK